MVINHHENHQAPRNGWSSFKKMKISRKRTLLLDGGRGQVFTRFFSRGSLDVFAWKKAKKKKANRKSKKKQQKCKWTSPFFPHFFPPFCLSFLFPFFSPFILLLCFLDFADLLFGFSILFFFAFFALFFKF